MMYRIILGISFIVKVSKNNKSAKWHRGRHTRDGNGNLGSIEITS